MSKDRSQALKGPISDRIRSGDIPVHDVERVSDKPSAEAVRGAEGHGMGNGAGSRGGNAGAS